MSLQAPPNKGWVCQFSPDNEWCTVDDPCFSCDEAAHAARHPSMDVEGCPTCKLRSVQLSPAATPTKTRQFGEVGKLKGNNSWERGIVTDARGMPILKPDGNLIRSAEYAEKRHSIEEGRRQLAQEKAPASS